MKLHPEGEAKAEVEKKQQNHHQVSRLDCSPVAMQSACEQALNQEISYKVLLSGTQRGFENKGRGMESFPLLSPVLSCTVLSRRFARHSNDDITGEPR